MPGFVLGRSGPHGVNALHHVTWSQRHVTKRDILAISSVILRVEMKNVGESRIE